MEEKLVREIMDFKIHNRLPDGLTKQQRYTIKRRAATFVLKDGVLHYICRRRQGREHLAKVVLSAAEADLIFKELHSSNIGGHCGVEKTHHAIISRYYWPGMEADIRKWVAQCPECQAKRASLKEKMQYNPIEVTEPFELVGMDLMKLTLTEGGNQYICVMVDYFTKWAEAYPLKNKSAEQVTNCIVDFVYKFGAPQRLLTDQGTEFKNQVNARLCKALGIERSFCAPYHPQTNGLVEKLNGTIQRSLGKLAQKNPQQWDKCLQATMFALRTKKQLTTQFSPYFLMFGREARYPSEVPVEYEVTTDKVEGLIVKEEISKGLAEQKTNVYCKVLANVNKSQAKVRKRKQDKGCDDHFNVGDTVLKQNIREQQRKGGKLEKDMLGPYTITSIKGKVVCLASQTSKTIANIDQITKFTEPEARIPAKLAKINKSPLTPPRQPTSSPSSLVEHIQSPDPPSATSAGEMQPTHSKVLNEILNIKGEILLSKIGPYKLFTADMQRLAPGEELESEVINAYLLWVAKRAGKSIKVIDTYEMTEIWNGTAKGMRKLDIREWDTLVGAVCKNNHWTLVAMYPKDGRSIFVDPFGATSSQLKHCRDSTRAFMRKKNFNISRWGCDTVSHPHQQDSTSCGVLVCKVAESLLSAKAIDFAVDEVGINGLRSEIATTLMDDSDDLTDLCRACGEKDPEERDPSEEPVDHWIECSSCNRWFHWVCVGKPDLHNHFFCPACTPP